MSPPKLRRANSTNHGRPESRLVLHNLTVLSGRWAARRRACVTTRQCGCAWGGTYWLRRGAAAGVQRHRKGSVEREGDASTSPSLRDDKAMWARARGSRTSCGWGWGGTGSPSYVGSMRSVSWTSSGTSSLRAASQAWAMPNWDRDMGYWPETGRTAGSCCDTGCSDAQQRGAGTCSTRTAKPSGTGGNEECGAVGGKRERSDTCHVLVNKHAICT
ncbi:hypothetical protein GGX14DRAFT_671989 [Mycena pura]|uniref:Uncharacterized protein n=1 Tax=Mycena pura TaxID=153505 RepID=A0AAD6Y6R7_9AGAR|nr:hypothetical protein GGX14DRAFT_671989 [Mycena pura]